MDLTTYLNKLADSKDVTGGGSVAALVGTSATALTIKVLDNEKSRSRHSAVKPQIEDSQNTLNEMKDRLQELISEDEKSLQPLIDAKKLPKDSDEEKEARNKAIEEAVENAARPQVEILETLVQLLDHVEFAISLQPSGDIVTNLGESVLFTQSAFQVAHIGAITNYRELSVESTQKERMTHINQVLTTGTQRSTMFYQIIATYLNTGQWKSVEEIISDQSQPPQQ